MNQNTMQVGIGIPSPDAPRPSHVEEQTSALACIAKDLENIITVIEQRLSKVAIVHDLPNKDQQTPEPMLVPLAAHLRDLGRNFNSSVERLRRLSSSIEL